MNTSDFGVVSIGSIGGCNNAQCGDGQAIFGPFNILCKLIPVEVGPRHLNLDTVTGHRAGAAQLGVNGDRHTVQDGDGDAIADIEACSADTVGFNGPFANRTCRPNHVVEQQFGGDITNLAGCFVDLKPCQHTVVDSIAVSIVEIGTEVNLVIGRHFKRCARASAGVISDTGDGDCVQETVINSDVDAHGMLTNTIVVSRPKHVREFTSEVRTERRAVAHQYFEEGGGIAHGGVVQGPVGLNDPLVSFCIDSENLCLQRFIGGDLKVLPCCRCVVHFHS